MAVLLAGLKSEGEGGVSELSCDTVIKKITLHIYAIIYPYSLPRAFSQQSCFFASLVTKIRRLVPLHQCSLNFLPQTRTSGRRQYRPLRHSSGHTPWLLPLSCPQRSRRVVVLLWPSFQPSPRLILVWGWLSFIGYYYNLIQYLLLA